MGKAVLQKKCIRVGDVRKDVREIAEFYFDLDNKTNFTTYSVLCSPLIAANECIGVIHCLNKKTNEAPKAVNPQVKSVATKAPNTGSVFSKKFRIS